MPDTYEIRRDGILLATLPGTESGYTDDTADAGSHEYAVRALNGQTAGPDTVRTITIGERVAPTIAVPTIALSLLGTDTVRVTISGVANGATSHEIRRDGELIAAPLMPMLTFDDAGVGTGFKQYAVRTLVGSNRSADTVQAIDLSSGTPGSEALPWLDVFALPGAGSGGGGSSLDRDRLALAEQALAQVQDQPLVIFRDAAEREAFLEIHGGLRSATLDGEWTIHDGSRWQPASRATVLARVSGNQIYGTPDADTEAEQAQIHALLDVPSRVLRYQTLNAYNAG